MRRVGAGTVAGQFSWKQVAAGRTRTPAFASTRIELLDDETPSLKADGGLLLSKFPAARDVRVEVSQGDERVALPRRYCAHDCRLDRPGRNHDRWPGRADSRARWSSAPTT